MSPVRSTADLAFAREDVRRRRVETDDGSGQMRSGDETDWTFAVPLAIAVRHPERFDGLWLARGPNAREVLRRIDTCLSNEIMM
jgi:hypothetical protein